MSKSNVSKNELAATSAEGPVWFPEKLRHEYHFKGSLGSGVFGNVYLYRYLPNGNDYAIKQICVDDSNDLLIEVGRYWSFKHPNIVEYFHSWIDEKQVEKHLNIIMEYCPDGTLESKIQRRHFEETPWEIWKILREILGALRFLHEKSLLHRDVKPDNILFVGNMAKLSDFGLLTNEHMTVTCGAGSDGYQAPEVLVESYSTSADIWSLGIVTFELCVSITTDLLSEEKCKQFRIDVFVGEHKFPDGFMANFSQEVQDFAKSMLREMTAKKPCDRPSAEQLLEDTLFDNKAANAPPEEGLDTLAVVMNTLEEQIDTSVADGAVTPLIPPVHARRRQLRRPKGSSSETRRSWKKCIWLGCAVIAVCLIIGGGCAAFWIVHSKVHPVCPSNWTIYPEHMNCYRIIKAGSFDAVTEACKNLNSTLASVHSEEEAKFIDTLVPSSIQVWIGLVKNDKAQHEWLDGSSVDYENFAPPFFSSYSIIWNCYCRSAYGPSPLQWNVLACSTEAPAVCKRPAELTS